MSSRPAGYGKDNMIRAGGTRTRARTWRFSVPPALSAPALSLPSREQAHVAKLPQERQEDGHPGFRHAVEHPRSGHGADGSVGPDGLEVAAVGTPLLCALAPGSPYLITYILIQVKNPPGQCQLKKNLCPFGWAGLG